MSISRSRGPKTPTGISGSPLELCLKLEGMQAQEGLNTIDHIISHKTPGSVTRLIWKSEYSTLQHEYLLMGIATKDEPHLSWVRLERMGDLGSDGVDAPQVLMFIIASTMESLIHTDDITIQQVDLGSSAPALVDVATIISIVHAAASSYTLRRYNCWWFARKTFTVLVSNFMLDGPAKKKILRKSRMRNLTHALAAEMPGAWVTATVGLTTIIIVATVPPAAPVMVLTFGLTFIIPVTSFCWTMYHLNKTTKKIDSQVDEYIFLKKGDPTGEK